MHSQLPWFTELFTFPPLLSNIGIIYLHVLCLATSALTLIARISLMCTTTQVIKWVKERQNCHFDFNCFYFPPSRFIGIFYAFDVLSLFMYLSVVSLAFPCYSSYLEWTSVNIALIKVVLKWKATKTADSLHTTILIPKLPCCVYCMYVHVFYLWRQKWWQFFLCMW